MESLCFCVYFYRHQRKPDKTPGCRKGLWVLFKEKQTWQNSVEIPVAFALSHECSGKVLLFFFNNCELVQLLNVFMFH